MADEFAKGFGIFTTGMLGWMVFAGWFTTASFESGQLVAPPPENPDMYGQLSLILKDTLFYFAIIGALTFWVIIPAVNEARDALADRRS